MTKKSEKVALALLLITKKEKGCIKKFKISTIGLIEWQ